MSVLSDNIGVEGDSTSHSRRTQSWVTMTAVPLSSAPPLELKGVVEIQWDWNTEVHGHVLDVLSPVCGMSSQLLHLEEKCTMKTNKK